MTFPFGLKNEVLLFSIPASCEVRRFLKRLRFRIRYGRLAERTKAPSAERRQIETSRVQIPHLPQTPRDVQRAIPVSRQKHLLRSLRRYSSQGASLYVYRIETASKETDKLKEWKETVPNP